MKPGDIVHVQFLDHCMRSGYTGEGPLACEVFGRILDINKVHLTIACWLEQNGTVDHNSETFVILKSAITKIRRLK